MRKIKILTLTTLALQISLIQTSFAMQALEDNDLRHVDGQDGIEMNLQFSQIDIDRAYWEDNTGVAGVVPSQLLQASANTVKVRHNPDYKGGSYNLGANLKLDMGSNGTNNGVDLKAEVQPLTFSANNFCIQTAGSACTESIGNFAVQTGSPTKIHFRTTDGLFNKQAPAELTIGLENINIYTGLKSNAAAVSNIYNQLIIQNTNFNFNGKGVIYVDNAQGFVIHTNAGATPDQKVAYGTIQSPTAYGYVDLTRVALPSNQQTNNTTSSYYDAVLGATGSGLNLEFMMKKDANIDATTPVYSLANSKGLIRIGASGRVVNAFLQARGINASGLGAPTYSYDANTKTGTNDLNNVLGYATQSGTTTTTAADDTVMGSTGIALRLHGEFTKTGDSMLAGGGKATTLEIGGAGSNTYGFEFSELHPLIYNSQERAYFDSGNVYINLANTQHLRMPVNTVLTKQSRLGGSNSFLTAESDYNQQIHGLPTSTPNPKSVVMAIRGADFQAVSHRGRFTSSAGILDNNNAIAANAGTNNSWGLGLPFYNLNANMALYPTTYAGNIYELDASNGSGIKATPLVNASQRIGFAMALSVEGRNPEGTKTTSIMVVDAANKYYVGLRNVDMYLRGYGSMGFENGQLNVNLPDLLMVMAAELAAGRLPSFSNPTTGTGIVNAFDTKADVLLGLKLKLLGDMNFSLLPQNSIADGNSLGIIGRYKLTAGTVQMSDPIDDSMVGLDTMSGVIDFNNKIVINKDTVGFNYGFTFNPERTAQDVFRVKDVNFYPPSVSTTTTTQGQRVGELALTGGRINANLGIIPRNTGFQLKP